MADMKRRNPPETPKTAKFDAEILLSLYREGGQRRVFRRELSILEKLIKAAMRRCDYFGDSPAAREQMRRDCVATPLHLQSDLLDHFNEVNQKETP